MEPLPDEEALSGSGGSGELRASAYEAAALVAIVGRPNVGKSRLFNRMTGTRFAIVEDEPGVTRDRQYGEGVWCGLIFQVVDTGGFEPESCDDLLVQMREQAQLAIDEADVIVFVLDGQTGLLPADVEIAALLRTTLKPVIFAVNKIDGPRQDADISEFYALGVEVLYGISAEHGRGYEEFMDALAERLPEVCERREPHDDGLIRVAVLGRPNAGKSSLVNQLLGEDRLLTSDVPGTTRDAINTYVERAGRRFLFIDTAGIRRKRSISRRVEKYSVVQAFKAMDRADVVVYLLDALRGVTTQDQRVLGMSNDKGRASVVVLNKWDLVEKDHRTADEMIRDVRDELKFARHAPMFTASALTGQRVQRLVPMIVGAYEQYTRRISTGELNRFFEEAMRRNPPKSKGSRRLKVFYASQVGTRPPTLMFVVNDATLVHFSYRRYLENALRLAYGFEGTPIKVFFRSRGKTDKGEV